MYWPPGSRAGSGTPVTGQASAPERPQQVGIVSWGRGCGEDGLWGVYTAAGKHRPWINDQLRVSRPRTPSHRPSLA